MRIALICEFFPKSKKREMRGGVEARTYYIAKNLAKDHEVTVFSNWENGLKRKSVIDGVNVVRVPPRMEYTQSSSMLKRLLFMRNASRLCREGGFDVVDGSAVVGYPAAWWSKADIRTITYHDVWLGRWKSIIGVKGVFGDIMERYVLGRDWNQIIAVSNYTRDNLIGAGVDPHIVKVVENGIDVKQYGGIEAEKDSSPTICCVARLVDYKRVDDLLNVFPSIASEFGDLRMKIIGTGPKRHHLEKLAARLGISGRVDFLGFVESHSDVLKHIKSSHVLALPSSVEGYGISVVEAMALDVPYVASDIAPIREATRGGQGGILYPVTDLDELSRSLISALSGSVKAGYVDIGGYDWSLRAKALASIWESL